MLKNILHLLLFFTTLSTAYSSENMSVNFCVYDNPPLIIADRSDKVRGIGADIIRHIAEKENLRINFIVASWGNCIKMLESNEADMMFPIAYSQERSRRFIFNNETVLTDWGQLYIGEQAKINSILDLEGKKIAVLKDDIYFIDTQGLKNLLESFKINAEFIYVESYSEVLDKVSKGEADAGLVNRLYGQLNESSFNTRRTSILIKPVEIRYALTANKAKSIVLAEMLDKHIAEMKADNNSFYHQLLDRWTGSKEEQTNTDFTAHIITVLGLFIIFLLFISLYLRVKISGKNKEIQDMRASLSKASDERREADSRVIDSEEKYSNLFHTSASPIIITDAAGIILDSNNAVERQLGYTHEDLCGKKISFLFPEIELNENIVHVTDKDSHSFEKEFYRKNGDKFDAEVSVNSFSAGNTRFTQIVIRDITVRKKTQKILAQKKRDLEKRVQEEIEHNRLQEQMLMQQSKLAAMGQMISAIAHQWRQPLTAIGLYVQDVEDAYEYGELNMEYISRFRDSCMEQIAYMSKTIDDFRNFFKTDKEKEIFDLGEVIREVLSLIYPQLLNNNIQLKTYQDDSQIDFKTMHGDLGLQKKNLTAYGYPNEFKQVMLNLIANSRDAIIEARIGGDDKAGLIKIIMTNENGIIKITIEDNGCGISDEIKDKIFEPYFSTKDDMSGLGIGLYMSKAIIENNMEGRIYVNDTEKGASITIELKQWDLGIPTSQNTEETEEGD